MGWLAIPLALVLGISAWLLWAAHPFWQARQSALQGDWSSAARLAGESASRDQAFVFHQAQAGLGYARAWRDTRQPADLDTARAYLQAALEREPSFSLPWANLGVLDLHAGDTTAALAHLQEAIRRSPGEPSYWLNLGAVHESNGDVQAAQDAYQRVLTLAPGWAGHPFWQQNAFRRAIVMSAGTLVDKDMQQAHWRAACEAVRAGRYDEARLFLAEGRAAGEDDQGILGCTALLAEMSGHVDEARSGYQAIEHALAGHYLNGNAAISDMYARFHRRAGFDMQVVPGYLVLANDVGQFASLEAYYHLRVREDGCAAAYSTWEIWQRALRGGALDPLPEPDCRPTVMLTSGGMR